MDIVGWCYDPYGVHEQRWFSDGTPTKLVRDADVESYDLPPPMNPPRPVIRVTDADRSDGSDLRSGAAPTKRVAAARLRWRPRRTSRP